MRRERLSEEQKEQLGKLKCIAKVTDYKIEFTEEFREFCISETAKGRTIYEVVREAGVDISLYKSDNLYSMLKKWRKRKKAVIKPKGRPKNSDKPTEELTIEELKAKLALAEAEIAFLKKVKASKS